MRYGRCLVKTLDFPGSSFRTLVSCLTSSPYTPSSGKGFHVRHESSHSFLAFFIRDRVVRRTHYDPLVQAFSVQDVTEPLVVPFSVDSERKILEVYGSKQSVGEIVTELGKQTSFGITVGDAVLDLSSLCNYLNSSSISFSLKGTRVSEFEIVPGVLASCSLNLASVPSSSVIDRFLRAAVWVSMTVVSECGDVPVTVYRDGHLSIGVDNDDDPETYELIRNQILEGALWQKTKSSQGSTGPQAQ